MKLKEIPRTATFAWSPTPGVPRIVTGTASGTIDPDFSSATRIELWDLDLGDRTTDGVLVSEPVASAETTARFNALEVSADGSNVVGALENGVVEAWRISARGEAPSLKSLGSSKMHSGIVKTLAWNPNFMGRFASGGGNGQVFVYDVDDLQNPTTPAAQPARHDEIVSVAWNNRVSHILASAGSSGSTSIWDLKKRREVIHLHYAGSSGSRLTVSKVAWHPTNSTKLATASNDDTDPAIMLWDLRNASSPERILRGHQSGILSMDWCRHDESLMLTSARDNRTLLWNPIEGVQLGEYPVSVEWTFKSRFSPCMPDLFASATFDDKIVVQTLQDCSADPSASSTSNGTTAAGGDDFWDSASVMVSQHPTFSVMQAPQWLKRPVSAKFGFGGKMVMVRTVNGKSTVSIDTVSDVELPESARKFNELLAAGDYNAISELHSNDTNQDWEVLNQMYNGTDIADEFKTLLGVDSLEEEEDIFEALSAEPHTSYMPQDEFPLFVGENDDITKLVLSNQLDQAVTKLISRQKSADALLLASYAGPEALAKAQVAYLSENAQRAPFLRAAYATANTGQHLDDLARHADVSSWQTIMSVLLSHSGLSNNAGELGARLAATGQRDSAMRVFLAGKNISRAAQLWLAELPELERKIKAEQSHTSYTAYVLALQQTLEKIIVASQAVGGVMPNSEECKALNDAVRDYADVVSSQGDLVLAKKLLDMLPAEYQQEKARLSNAPRAAGSVVSARQGAPLASSASNLGLAQPPPLRVLSQTRMARQSARASTPGAPATPAPPPTAAMVAAMNQPSAPQPQPSAPAPHSSRYVPTTPVEHSTVQQTPYTLPKVSRTQSRQSSMSGSSNSNPSLPLQQQPQQPQPLQQQQQPAPAAAPAAPAAPYNPYASFSRPAAPVAPAVPAAPVAAPPPGPAMLRAAPVQRPLSRATAPTGATAVVGGANPFPSALTGASTAAASIQASAEAALAAQANAAAAAANAGAQALATGSSLERPLSSASKPPAHGWNDLPTLPNSAPRRAPAPKVLKAVVPPQAREGSCPPPPRADTPSQERQAAVQAQQALQAQQAQQTQTPAHPYGMAAEAVQAPVRAPAAPRVNPYAPAAPSPAQTLAVPAGIAPSQSPAPTPEKRNQYAPPNSSRGNASPASGSAPPPPPQGPPRSHLTSPLARVSTPSSRMSQVTYATSKSPLSASPNPPVGAGLARAPPVAGPAMAVPAPPPAPAAIARAPPAPAPARAPPAPASASAPAPAAPAPVTPAPASSHVAPNETPSRLEAATPLTSAANAVRAQMKYPAGDRSHISAEHLPVYQRISAELARVKPYVYERFTKQFVDSERRFEIMFDQLNNNLLPGPLVSELLALTASIESREYEAAQQVHRQLVTLYADASRSWAPGIKRLIAMGQAVPVSA